ncbi:AMP-binding protein, partial [Paenibacillus sp. 598K]|uniref:AMP-binding protein n=1 Tax=Paenibacillus sp. 598K TaxID=1117987 RepID=UPI00162A5363
LLETAELNGTRLPAMRTVSVTGEKLTTALARRWFAQFPAIPLVNAYGPTEASDDVTLHVLRGMPDAQQIPVGRPIRNVTIYILDERQQPCPIGVKGEICVSGLAVGRGYLHDAERTRLAFGEDRLAGRPGVRLYRTGDIGRWLPDGTIEYAGRLDDQIKLHGYR